jgi:nicotinamidase-related amidase
MVQIPAHYSCENARSFLYSPQPGSLRVSAADWLRAPHQAAPGKRIHLLLIDLQRDFCFPEGALYVGGRSGDGALLVNDRIARFIYRNLHLISEITCTLDTHKPFQIFSPAFWHDAEGRFLPPHTEITAHDVERGIVRPNPRMADLLFHGNLSHLRSYVLHYCRTLEANGRYRLRLWPEHCLYGSLGHTLAGVVEEAVLFHSYVTGIQPCLVSKGMNALTENYSAFAPEVRIDESGKNISERESALMNHLLSCDFVAGSRPGRQPLRKKQR